MCSILKDRINAELLAFLKEHKGLLLENYIYECGHRDVHLTGAECQLFHGGATQLNGVGL